MVILPRKNEKDLRDIPDEIRRQIKLVLVDSTDQVMEAALRRKPQPLVPRAPGGGGARKGQPLPVPAPAGFPADQPPAVASGRAPRPLRVPLPVGVPVPGLAPGAGQPV